MKNWIISTSLFLILLIGSFVIGPSAWAKPDPELIKSVLEKQKSCGTFVRYDDQNIYLGFGRYQTFEWPRKPVPGSVRIVPLDGSAERTIPTHDGATDLVSVNGHLFILTFSAIEEWDLAKSERLGEYSTYDTSSAFDYMQAPFAMAQYKGSLIITHGRLGLSFFDLKSRRITQQYNVLRSQLPLESTTNGVSFQGHLAYISVDSFTLVHDGDKPPFQGIIIVDLETQKVVSQLDGMDPGVTAILSDDKNVIVSFTGVPVWKYDRASLKGTQVPTPKVKIWQYPLEGHPDGSPAMDEKYIYTCFGHKPATPGDNNGFYRFWPEALNRSQLRLD